VTSLSHSLAYFRPNPIIFHTLKQQQANVQV
jgi:hypothetical protein